MKPGKPLNDTAWEHYVAEKKLNLDGTPILVEASELKKITKREPRLLAKFDEPKAQPAILRNAGYSVLPVQNGLYLLFRGDIFQTVAQCVNVGTAKYTLPFPLLTAGRGLSEMQYIDYAHNVGILDDFVGQSPLYLTIRGRERSSSFDFVVDAQDVHVEGVQIEVDGGYEGARDVILIEAKVGAPTSFNIRQLYYPYRRFLELVPGKRIRPVFMSYEPLQQVYALYEYRFREVWDFRSLELKTCRTYQLPRAMRLVADELQDVRYETDTSLVPQADDLVKVMRVVDLVNEGLTTSSEIALSFSVSQRQGFYYKEAAEYLGLILRSPQSATVTPQGVTLLDSPIDQQPVLLAKLIANSWIFRQLTQIARTRGFFSEQDIREIIEAVEYSPGKTYEQTVVVRRTGTILAWVRWLSQRIGCYEQDVAAPNRFRLH